MLESLYAGIVNDPHHDLKSIVIVRDGHLVSERCFNDDCADALHSIQSVTKSITGLLMRKAIQPGQVHSVGDSIAPYLPDLSVYGKEKIIIQDLRNMRSDLNVNDDDPNTPGGEDDLDKSSDWLKTTY